MSNPTSNFNWQMPTNTDLVTDLPADFEVFGQAVDTSLADLKGGTTGQILSKATNTDMDFVWIANDQGDITGITATSPLTGGGTSGAITVGIQSASTSQSGAVQLTDSTSTTSSVLAATPTAVKSAYDLAASAYAPAFTNNFYAGKNKIINGDFGVWQRGTSFSNLNGYFADRWTTIPTGTPTTMTTSQQAFTSGTAPVAGYEGSYFARNIITTVGTLTSIDLVQKIENVRTYAGQTVTLSFWAKGDSARTSLVYLYQDFGLGGSSGVFVNTPSLTISTSWTRYTYTFSVPSIAGKTIGTNSSVYVSIRQAVAAGSSIDIWGVQVEAGSVATPFQTATGTIQGELAACQRYFQLIGAYQLMGSFYNSGAASFVTTLPVVMRTTPTPTYNSTLTNAVDATGVANRTPTSYSTYGVNSSAFGFTAVGMAATTVYTPATYIGGNHQLSAEL
jgi:hypothetical protein